MAVAKLTTKCTVKSITGNNIHGEPTYGEPRTSICAVLKLIKSRKPTTVRTDSAGSRGHADEANLDAHLLMLYNDPVDLDDYILVHGMTMRVAEVRPRFDVNGNLDHLEVKGDIE